MTDEAKMIELRIADEEMQKMIEFHARIEEMDQSEGHPLMTLDEADYVVVGQWIAEDFAEPSLPERLAQHRNRRRPN